MLKLQELKTKQMNQMKAHQMKKRQKNKKTQILQETLKKLMELKLLLGYTYGLSNENEVTDEEKVS